MASNAQLGKIILLIAIVVFFYYFFWVAILPFMILDEGEYQNKQEIRLCTHTCVSVYEQAHMVLGFSTLRPLKLVMRGYTNLLK